MAAEGRPTVDAGLLGDVLATLPNRLKRRLDAEPALAEAWTWEIAPELVVVTAGEARTELRPVAGVVAAAERVTCDCLLAPHCLHVAAVLLRLAPAIAIGRSGGEDPATADPSGVPPGPAMPAAAARPRRRRTTVDADRTVPDAARSLSLAVARVLDLGASSAGVVVTGEILRAVHTAQLAGLHRAAAAGLRVVEGLARLRADEPEFRLGDLRNDLAEVLAVTRRLQADATDAAAIGVARRAYDPIGALRLYGLFAEPVIARSGYAGCVTTFIDAGGRLWVLSDVQPGEPERATWAYLSPLGLGDVALSHQAAARAGVNLGEARASTDGRLGRGQQVRAVRSAGAAWTEPPIDARFRVPLADQLAAAWTTLDGTAAERREGATLLFLEAVVLGAQEGRLAVAVDGTAIACVAPTDHAELAYHENLATLAAVPGARLRLIGRAVFDRPGTIELLALGTSASDGPELPEGWAGRVNLGFDRLPRTSLVAGAPAAVTPRHAPRMCSIRSCADSIASWSVGGRRWARPTRSGVEHDLAVLHGRHLPTGAAVLDALSTTAIGRSGQAELGERWLAAVTYARVAHRRVAAARWLDG